MQELKKIDEVPEFQHGLSEYFLNQLKSDSDREAVKTYSALRRGLEWNSQATIMLNNAMVDFMSAQKEMHDKMSAWEEKMKHPMEIVIYLLKKPINILLFILTSAFTAGLGALFQYFVK